MPSRVSAFNLSEIASGIEPVGAESDRNPLASDEFLDDPDHDFSFTVLSHV
jgi:hypothetical protein